MKRSCASLSIVAILSLLLIFATSSGQVSAQGTVLNQVPMVNLPTLPAVDVPTIEVPTIPAVSTIDLPTIPEVPTVDVPTVEQPALEPTISESPTAPEVAPSLKAQPNDLAAAKATDCTPGPNKDLTECVFNGMDLGGANFSGSNLTGATFNGANLACANFNGANLTAATLDGANLTGATFAGATFNATTFGASTTCPDGTLSGANGNSCVNNLVTSGCGAPTATATTTTTPVTTTPVTTPSPTSGTPAVLSVTIDVVSIAGGGTAQGTVTLTAPAPAGGVTVTLISDNPVAGVPATVFIPAGSTTGTFVISTVNVPSSTSVRITATLGDSSQHSVLIVVPAIASGETPTVTATETQPEQTLTPVETAVATETQTEVVLTQDVTVTLVAQSTTQEAQATTIASVNATTTPMVLRSLPNTGNGSSNDAGRTTSNPIEIALVGMAFFGLLAAAAIARKQHWFDSRS